MKHKLKHNLVGQYMVCELALPLHIEPINNLRGDVDSLRGDVNRLERVQRRATKGWRVLRGLATGIDYRN